MSLIRKHIRIDGMTCINCQNKIEEKLRRTAGVREVTVRYTNGTADISYDPDLISYERIVQIIGELDYRVLGEKERMGPGLAKRLGLLAVILCLYAMLEVTGILNLLVPGQLAESSMGYGMLFVIGLVTSVHCIAMCGGINLSQCIPQGGEVSQDGRDSQSSRMGQGGPVSQSGRVSRLSQVTGQSSRAGQDGAVSQGNRDSRSSQVTGQATRQSGRAVGSMAVFGPALLYNLGRVTSYTAVGFALGLAGMIIGKGAEVGMPVPLQGAIKMAAGLCMVIMGINMLGLFPWLRKFTIRMPGAAARRLGRRRARSRRPFYVGLLNGFMPCGPLQSMWIVALATGNPVFGALSMFFFSIGTVPLMLGFGSIVSALGRKFTDRVMEVGAVLVAVLGLAMVSQGLSLSGHPVESFFAGGIKETAGESAAPAAEAEDGVQVIRNTLVPGRFPNITVQVGIPVRWVIDAPEGSINSCNYKMRIPEYNLEHTFQTGENVIEFTPEETGTFPYSCWMGMIRANIFVVDGTETSLSAENEEVTVPVPAGYVIPSEEMAIAEQSENGDYLEVSISLTDEGFSPAVIVVEKDKDVVWYIQSELSGELLVPAYATELPLIPGNNGFSLIPDESFEVSTGDHSFYAYVKVVEDIGSVDEEAIRQEVSEFETLIYPDSVFAVSGMSCCQ